MMMGRTLAVFAAATAAAANFVAQPPPTTKILSKNYPGAFITYKETHICETTPGVRAWSGFVHMPSSLLADVPAQYDVNMFFWYFEARNNPRQAPTSLYSGGGPGASALDDVNGLPCTINPDSNSTTPNPWAWNADVNMLYVDQPVYAGYSYVALENGVTDYLNFENPFTPVANTADFVQKNATSVPTTRSTQDPLQTVNTTAQAARTQWHFSQIWFQEFPEYKTSNSEVSLWANSYGGFWAPGIFAHFQDQNKRIANGSISDKNAKPLRLGTVGITNGCIDIEAQAASYPEFAFNNTYGIQVIPEEVYQQAKTNLTKPGGCYDLIHQCQAAGAVGDPLGYANNDTVNQICAAASQLCFVEIQGAYSAYSDRSVFDIAHLASSVFPEYYSSSFFNQPWVQQELGVPLNFTANSPLHPTIMFGLTGDPFRRTKGDLEYLISNGVRVALVYGDRDYRCNWLGVENVSLALNYAGADAFRAAGYANLVTNATYTGGLVRQHANVSFSRVFQAGHGVTAYQPETVFRIFQRAMFGRDVATGAVAAGGNYGSVGAASTLDHREKAPDSPLPICFIDAAPNTCAPNQIEALAAGTAVIKNFIVVSPAPELPGGTPTSGGPGGTGTGKPTPTQSTSVGVRGVALPGMAGIVLGLVVVFYLVA